MGPGVLLFQVVNVIGSHQGYFKLTAQGKQHPVDFLKLGNGVSHYFQIEVAEGLLVPPGSLLGVLEAPAQNKLGNLTANTGAEGDKALMVLLQQFLIYSRLIVETFQVGFGGKLNQVLVSGLVFGEEDEVVVVFISSAAAGEAVRGDIDLAADNRLDADFPGCLVELNHAVHHAVVGDGQAVHT
ncbi:hypothetical protein ES703_99192 [subsurface metagenome]